MSSSSHSTTNSALVVLFYGALVEQICKDLGNDVALVNERLAKMGRNIGERLVEDFFSRSHAVRVGGKISLGETMKKACKMYLGVDSTVISSSSSSNEASSSSSDFSWDLQLECNPFQEHFQVPIQFEGLAFSAVLAGIAEGALKQVQMDKICVSQVDNRTFRFKQSGDSW